MEIESESLRQLSRPVRMLIRYEQLHKETTVFDYGCGTGADVAMLQKLGIAASGWDPAHSPSAPLVRSDVVNLGYVLNVIDEPVARRDALEQAWSLSKRVLSVAVPVRPTRHTAGSSADLAASSASIIPGLCKYVDETLGVKCVPVRKDISWIFRSESQREAFVARHLNIVLGRRRQLAAGLTDFSGPVSGSTYSRRKLLENAAAAGAIGVAGAGISVFASTQAAASESLCPSRAEIEERVKTIVVEHLGVDEGTVTPEASYIDDLGADSLDTVELVMAYEEEFDTEIPDDAAEQMSTVGDSVAFLCRSLGR